MLQSLPAPLALLMTIVNAIADIYQCDKKDGFIFFFVNFAPSFVGR